jgi:hypothetical protein
VLGLGRAARPVRRFRLLSRHVTSRHGSECPHVGTYREQCAVGRVAAGDGESCRVLVSVELVRIQTQVKQSVGGWFGEGRKVGNDASRGGVRLGEDDEEESWEGQDATCDHLRGRCHVWERAGWRSEV